VRILDELDDAVRDVRGDEIAGGAVRLGAFATAAAGLVPKAAQRFAMSPQRDAIAAVSRCRVFGGHGLPPKTGALWELVFTPESLRLVDSLHNETLVP
jgi:hypothetical protein